MGRKTRSNSVLLEKLRRDHLTHYHLEIRDSVTERGFRGEGGLSSHIGDRADRQAARVVDNSEEVPILITKTTDNVAWIVVGLCDLGNVNRQLLERDNPAMGILDAVPNIEIGDENFIFKGDDLIK